MKGKSARQLQATPGCLLAQVRPRVWAERGLTQQALGSLSLVAHALCSEKIKGSGALRPRTLGFPCQSTTKNSTLSLSLTLSFCH